MLVKETVIKKLTEELSPDYLEVIDESEKHKGHPGYREKGESHFKVVVSSAKFEDMEQIPRHLKIYNILSDEMNNPIHALSIEAFTPEERQNKA